MALATPSSEGSVMRPLGAASMTLEAQRDQVLPSASHDQVVILQVVDQAAGGSYCLHLF
jgi:hypothetical protein